MKKDYTDTTLLLDRSGSMDVIRDDTIGGINAFLDMQKQLPGEIKFSLYQFDTVYENVIDGKPIKEVLPITRETFIPRGGTALLDGIGRTINSIGDRLSKLPEKDRPNKVSIAIVTDGEENSSREFTRDQIFDMITHQTDVYKWDFVFLGANQDAIKTGNSYGVITSNCCKFSSTQESVVKTFAAYANYGSGLHCNGVGVFN